VGDEVLAFAEWKEKGDNSDQDQRLSYEKVTDIFTSHREQRLIHITLETGEKLTATDGHPFKTSEGWRDAIMLKKGGKLLLKGAGEETDAERSEEGERTVTIKDVQIEQKIVPAYNLEVANVHTFFIGEEGVLVHNKKKNRKACQDYGTAGGKEHRKGARKSTRKKHEDGRAATKKSRAGEKGDTAPPRRRPQGHKGPWPPKT
jgi:hypothetical protein